jgi:hypothetical protein
MVNHPIHLRGLVFDKATGAPVPAERGAVALLERQDQQFVLALLGELASPEGRKQTSGTVISNGAITSGGLKLFQPVHGVHTVALLEAYCDVFGEPRVAPAQIESAGLVIRRVGEHNTRLAWMRRDGKVVGWVSLRPDELDRDPKLAYREGPMDSGPAEVRRELLRRMGSSSRDEETMTSLFVAPPEACANVGRTILYGLVQTASGETSDGSSASTTEGFDRSQVVTLLAPYFTAGKSVDWKALADLKVTYDDVAKHKLSEDVQKKLSLFIDLLRGLVSVFDAFETKPLLDAMNKVQLEYANGVKKPAGTMLAEAAKVLIQGKSGYVTLPKSWPTVNSQTADLIITEALKASGARIKQIIPPEQRFERRGAQYVARAFIRIRRDDGCPPKIVWSPESAPFTIAPWYEKGKTPPVMVSLPSIKDLSAFKPNVTFKVPQGLFNLLGKNDAKSFLEGNAKPSDDSGGIGWLCSFNIPIITLCAFIVLNIILSLLNIVFFWMAFIKICIPIPQGLAQRFKD